MLYPDHVELLPAHDGIPSSFELETIVDHRKARWYHACFHTVCAVLGAGVLGLSSSFSYLGWVGGLVTLSVLCAASIYTSWLLACLHEDPDGRRRYDTYKDIGISVWGPRYGGIVVEIVQYTLCVGLCITYSVTAGQSMQGMANKLCDGEDCQQGLSPWIVLFGCFQLALSQVPDVHSLWWVSLVGGIMSIGYCLIAAGASISTAISNARNGISPPWTRADESTADYVFEVFNSLGGIAFTFGGQAVLPEIQATLARPPKTQYSMMKGIIASYVVVIAAYFTVAVSGYAAFGAAVQPDVLLSISHPKWLVDLANGMVVFHVAAGYQIFAMPMFEVIERGVKNRWRGHTPPRPLALRLVFRSLYVFFTTLIACILPFFGDLMGLIASIGLMPVTFILPPLLWIGARHPQGIERAVCLSLAVGTFILAILSLIGSVRNIIVHSIEYDFLG